MPKVVDPQQRADEIANAVFIILCTEGLPAVTLGRVAERTGLAIGSIRHYYPTHQLLVESALTLLITTISERIYRHYDHISQQHPSNQYDRAVLVLEELLPLDTLRHQEAILWLRLMNEAVHNEVYSPYAARLNVGMRDMVAQILQNTLSDIPLTELDKKVEGLSVFIDGLTIAMLAPGSTITPETAHELFTRAVKTTISHNKTGSIS